ncbi:glycosyltransferase family 9 protein [Candidatus Methylomirabilis sp.]|uniref:Glycosyltransferase family 9 protein n=1 Tax=Candidatus Methylomirabilis tolerans TaxID=3123416 RepID=A0AAJ1EHY2_9BACT|nr:glycosyltransferase family 9 protein [Candidatus Methylomirabilis sp.]
MTALLWNAAVPMEQVQRILIIKPSSIGDVVNALPFLSSLRQRYPDRHIAWLIEEEAAELLLGHPLLDQVIVSGRRRWGRQIRTPFRWAAALREIAALVAELRQGRYDLVVDLQGLLKSALMVVCVGAQYRVGLTGAREGSERVLTHVVPLPPGPLHAVDRYLEAARFLGADPLSKAFVFPSGSEDEARAEALLAEAEVRPDTLVVALNPHARWRTKLWEEERFARLGEMLAQRHGAKILLIGSSSDLPSARRVASRMNPAPLVAAGRTDLTLLIALLKRIDLLVTVDSGPMHLAAALQTPLVALFGPTDPRLIGPYDGDLSTGQTGGVVLRAPLPCSPCSKRWCRIDADRLCMRSISVEEVAEAASALLTTGATCRTGRNLSSSEPRG